MKSAFQHLLPALALACGSLISAGSASAQGTWTAAASGDTCNPGVVSTASFSCTQGAVKATLTTYGYFEGSSSWAGGRLGDFNQYGFGAYTGKRESSGGSTGSTGQHAFDNITSGCGSTVVTGNSGLSTANSGCGGSIEALLVSFTNANTNAAQLVNLTQVTTGWTNGDADLSVYRWDGAGAPSAPGLGAVNMSAGTIAGWTLVGSNDMDATTNSFNTGGNTFSSYFLVTTYFGATTAATATLTEASGKLLDIGNDRFKIDSFTAYSGCPQGQQINSTGNGAICVNITAPPPAGVPEPGSLALAGLALVGVFASRRKLKALF